MQEDALLLHSPAAKLLPRAARSSAAIQVGLAANASSNRAYFMLLKCELQTGL
jgi:hypothetical protein